MRFTMIVTGPAYGTQQASSAFQFAQALIASKNELTNVFFYQEGVYNANAFTSPAYDEMDLVRAWNKLYEKHNVSLYVCVASALRRGIINMNTSNCSNYSVTNLQSGFLLTGLSKLTEVILTCDRVVQF